MERAFPVGSSVSPWSPRSRQRHSFPRVCSGRAAGTGRPVAAGLCIMRETGHGKRGRDDMGSDGVRKIAFTALAVLILLGGLGVLDGGGL